MYAVGYVLKSFANNVTESRELQLPVTDFFRILFFCFKHFFRFDDDRWR